MTKTLMILKRNGVAVAFDAAKITAAVKKAFLFDDRGNARAGSNTESVRQQIDRVGQAAATAVLAKAQREGVISVRIEDVQDRVELELMRSGEHAVARDYVLFRQKRASERAADQHTMAPVPLRYTNEAGILMPLDRAAFMGSVLPLCAVHGHPEYADVIIDAALRDCFDGVSEANVRRALVLNARSQIERDPVFNKITAGLTLIDLKDEVFHGRIISDAEYFSEQIKTGIAIGIYSAQLAHFDLEKLAGAIRPDRDALFGFLGLQTLYDRYLVIDKTGKEARRIETPQGFLMRVAMGLAINEIHRDEKAVEFYDVLSKLDFMSSTPTLFNAGTARPQLSSCYLTTVSDDLDGIYEAIKENALLQKYAGGLGNDWTPVRAMGSHIKGTNGESQGTIPFLKVVNDTAVAVNQGGKRKGAVCAYLETWHLDIEEFLALRKNTGDDRRRTHDMNTAHWIPDLFMKRVMEKGAWTLFSPSDVPDLHELYGEAFEAAYIAYEARAAAGSIKLHKTVQAVDLWRDMLTMLFETGHPWLTFKDPINLRSPQQHVGVVHSSNLCVAPETKVLTDRGHLEISGLQDKVVNVWNGYEYSETTVRKTGESQRLLTVLLSNGGSLTCTPQHRWHLSTDYYGGEKVVETTELTKGDRLIKWNAPVVQGEGVFSHAYTHGFFCGDGNYSSAGKPMVLLYDEKKSLTPWLAIKSGTNLEHSNGRLAYMLNEAIAKKFVVPHGFSLDSRLAWLAGLLDADGTVAINEDNESIQLGSINVSFLEEIRLMLQTMGCNVKVALMRSASEVKFAHDTKSYATQPMFRLLITSYDTLKLVGLGLRTHRLRLNLRIPNRDAAHFVKVVAVVDAGRIADTFCFTEQKRHLGVFNGVLTGQCTEITLNTSDTEIAVCNLGSVNLVNHLVLGASGAYEIDRDKLRKTVKTAMRMLDNVIDINLYTVKKARTSNLKHRPVGLGIMGFQHALHLMRTPYASKEAVQFASESMEAVCFNAYWASSELAEERGRYSSYKGSLWDRGVFPQDSVALVTRARGEKYHLPVEITPRCDWDALRNRVKIHGMRNSNCVAIAPTATIANIVDVSASIEPNYQNLFVKSNMSGEFTVINEYLVHDLKKLALWDDEMIADLKYNDGALGKIDRIPATLKAIYATAFDNDPKWYVEAASARQRWIDQGQSLNIYVSGVSGKKLDELYKFAWMKGLKTTYYLRTMAATSAEKSTGNGGELNAVSANPMTSASQLPAVVVPRAQSAPDLTNSTAAFCSLDEVLNGACQSCQ